MTANVNASRGLEGKRATRLSGRSASHRLSLGRKNVRVPRRVLFDAERSKYFLFLGDGAHFDGDEPPGYQDARPASARFPRHLGLMVGRAVSNSYPATLI